MRVYLMQDYHQISIMPYLHKCEIGLFGVKPKSSYLVWREDTFNLWAVDKKMVLTHWRKTTGKVVKSQQIPQEGMGDY